MELNFYSHAPCGARLSYGFSCNRLCRFLLTRPLRGATHTRQNISINRKFLLTRPLRGATEIAVQICSSLMISTHTPLAGRDDTEDYTFNLKRHISTHTPLAGRDGEVETMKSAVQISTHTPLAGRDSRAD